MVAVAFVCYIVIQQAEVSLRWLTSFTVLSHTPFNFTHTRHSIVSLVLCAGFSYEGRNEAQKKDFEKAIETIAVAFSSK